MECVGAVLDIISQRRLINTLENYNDRLASENGYLRKQLDDEKDRYDYLKMQFDTQLGLVAKAETSTIDYKPIGGYVSRQQRLNNLSIVSRQKLQDSLVEQGNT